MKRAGITNGYQSKPCLNPADPECPETAPNKKSQQVSFANIMLIRSNNLRIVENDLASLLKIPLRIERRNASTVSNGTFTAIRFTDKRETPQSGIT